LVEYLFEKFYSCGILGILVRISDWLDGDSFVGSASAGMVLALIILDVLMVLVSLLNISEVLRHPQVVASVN